MGNSNQTGVWIIGAGGAVATTSIVGCLSYATTGEDPPGMITASDMVGDISFTGLDDLVFGGCELFELDLVDRARTLDESAGLFGNLMIDQVSDDLKNISDRIEPGLLPVDHNHISTMDEGWAHKPQGTAMDAVEYVRDQLQSFRESEDLEDVIVVNLASTEPGMDVDLPEDPDELLNMLKTKDQTSLPEIHPSVLYAVAAFLEDAPYVNFTPSTGNTPVALRNLAVERGIPHMGKDAKTGETLLKTVLAPMFLARNLKVLSWEGHNILGNADGKTLEDDNARKTKTEDKQKSLVQMMDDEDLHSRVRIDYVPSLGDWKTAWDFIHFQGFLDTKMSLQFIWQGSDSALAAPLVLDLVRFADLSVERGESGEMTHLASFFKTPLGCEEHDFHQQFQRLVRYIDDLNGAS
jgi:myo-inositol-1-phosphate synthase